MKKIKQLAVILVAILIMPSITMAYPALPLLVYGDVLIDDSPAAIETVITVENNGVEIISATVNSEGEYFINVPAENVGEILTYKVGGIIAVQKECADPADTPSDNIDLSIITDAPDPTPYCGDGICNGDEICSTCSTDCGSCNTGGTPSGTSGSTPSGSGTTPPSPPTVEEDEPDEEENSGEKKEEEKPVVLGAETDYRAAQLEKMLNEACYVWTGDASAVSANMGDSRDSEAEVSGYNKYTSALISGMDGLEQSNIYAITNFIVYGTPTTEILGAGERAGVLNSYKSAFGKLPATEEEWQDAIKIANGRWPSERSETAEANAKQEFEKVYLREPDMENPNDNAAVTIIAYGLRPDVRNLDSEQAGILTFKHIYGYNPASAVDWDIVRAIAYSGAVR